MGVQARTENLRSLAFGSIGASYTAIGAPFGFAISVFTLKNLTNATLLFSNDGVEDDWILPANSGQIIDITANHTSTDVGLYFIRGTQIYVKQSGVPTSGAVYIETLYDATN